MNRMINDYIDEAIKNWSDYCNILHNKNCCITYGWSWRLRSNLESDNLTELHFRPSDYNNVKILLVSQPCGHLRPAGKKTRFLCEVGGRFFRYKNAEGRPYALPISCNCLTVWRKPLFSQSINLSGVTPIRWAASLSLSLAFSLAQTNTFGLIATLIVISQYYPVA